MFMGVLAVAMSLGPEVAEAKRSAADEALFQKARKACNDVRRYPNGAIPVINYKGGWFRCREYRE